MGFVVVDSPNGSGSGVSVSGYFAAVLPTGRAWIGETPGCTATPVSDGCVSVVCTSVATTLGAGTVVARSSSGAVVSASLMDETIFDVPTRLYVGGDATANLRAGDVVAVSASGGEVPAFAGSVMSPTELTDVHLPSTVSRASDLLVSWTPHASSRVALSITGPPGVAGAPRHFVSCSSVLPTTVTVPQVALAEFAAGDRIAIVASAVNATTVIVGEYAIDIEAVQSTQSMATVVP